MTLEDFILGLLFMQLTRSGLRYGHGEFWLHVPSGERIAIPDITMHSYRGRAAAIKSITRRIKKLMED